MRPGHGPQCRGCTQAGEGGEVLQVELVGPAGLRVGDVGQPFDLRRDVGQLLELGDGETGRFDGNDRVGQNISPFWT